VYEVGVLEEGVPVELKGTDAMQVVQAESPRYGANTALEGERLDTGKTGYVGSVTRILQYQDLRIDPEPEQAAMQPVHRDATRATGLARVFVNVQDSHAVRLINAVSLRLSHVRRGKSGAYRFGELRRRGKTGSVEAILLLEKNMEWIYPPRPAVRLSRSARGGGERDARSDATRNELRHISGANARLKPRTRPSRQKLPLVLADRI
jgi:hypothetical protein